MPLPQLSIRKQRIKSSLEEGFLEIKVMKYQKRSSKLSLKVKEKKKKSLRSLVCFLSHTQLCYGFTPGSVSGRQMWYWGWNLGQLHARLRVPYSQYYLLNPRNVLKNIHSDFIVNGQTAQYSSPNISKADITLRSG